MHTERNGKNKTALVTGAASGIGFAFAENLAKQGYDLVMIDIQEDNLNQKAEQLRTGYSVEVNVLILDLSATDAAETAYQFCRDKNLAIHILISNAGRFVYDAITDIESRIYKTFLQLHVNTPANLCRLFGADMKSRHEGYILTVSSLSAWMPYPYLSLYSSTKRFLHAFTKAIHYEFSKYNVGVTTICPGAVDTGLFNLSNDSRKTARKFGIMTTPDSLAKRALKRMFRKRITYIPGIINKLSLPLIVLFPIRVLLYFYEKSKY